MKKYKHKDWLYQKYIVEKLSTTKIAEICKCSQPTICNWLKIHNIKIRTISEALIGKFCGKNNPSYRPLEERLWEKIDKKNNINECWFWTGYKNKTGHGTIRKNNIKKPVHVIVYELFYNINVKKNEIIHHICKNPSCCNPYHLQKMTHEKHSSLHHKGKIGSYGEKNGNSKLTCAKVKEIRNKYNTGEYTKTALGKEYGVYSGTIGRIINNKIWRE